MKKKNLLDVWNLVPLCLIWINWWERNSRTFEDMVSTGDQLLASLLSLCLTVPMLEVSRIEISFPCLLNL